MHELAIAQSALEQALGQAARIGGRRITRIVLQIGTLSGVDPDALRFAFDAILPSTPAAGAEIELETIAALARCPSCGHEFVPTAAALFECPHCRALGAELRRGRELTLARLDCL